MEQASLSQQVQELYAMLGRWRLVAKACNTKRAKHSPGYYQQVASGRIKKPSPETIVGIENAPAIAAAILSAPKYVDTRKTVHLYQEDLDKDNEEPIPLGLPCPDMISRWYSAYREVWRGEEHTL